MKTFLQALSDAGQSLVAAIEVGVRHAMLQAYARANLKKPDEPDFVAAILVDALPIFGSHLNAVCVSAGGVAKLTGIFCHGKPEVKHSGGAGCELGDILFAHFHTDAAGTTRRMSLLLQVKMSASQIYVVPKNEHVQLLLYSAWPSFEYKRTSSLLNGEQRDVFPKSSHRGAQYLLLDNGDLASPTTGLIGSRATTPALVALPNATLHANERLSEVLVELLAGRNGRAFLDRTSVRNTAGRGWSAVVWDLLEHGATHAFNRKMKAGFVKHPRSVSAMNLPSDAFIVRSGGKGQKSQFLNEIYGDNRGENLDKWLDDGGEGPPPVQSDIGDSEDGGGLGVVVIETSEARLETQWETGLW